MAPISGGTRIAPASYGALPSRDGVTFRVWAPEARELQLVLHDGRAAGTHAMAPADGGVFETWVRNAAAGDTYGFRMDGGDALPDPASRYQPHGVHGPSQVIDAAAYRWSDEQWRPRRIEDLVVYELHV